MPSGSKPIWSQSLILTLVFAAIFLPLTKTPFVLYKKNRIMQDEVNNKVVIDIPEKCLDFPDISLRFANDAFEICMRYDWDTLEICLNICHRFSRDMVCKKYA